MTQQAATAPMNPARPILAIRSLRRLRGILLHMLSLIILLLAWEIEGRLHLVKPFLLPTLESVVARLVADLVSGAFAHNATLTLYRALSGFLACCVIGIPLGILMSRRALIGWFFEPLVSVGYPLPKLAFLPIFMLWFGVFDLSKIVMVAFSSIFTVIAAADAGTRGVEKRLVWSAQSLGASQGAIFFEVMLPAALPQILTGLQVALPLCLITAVAAEMLMGGAGLGGAMVADAAYADSVGVYAGLVETALVGSIAVILMARLRRHLLRWHAEFARS